MNAKQSQFFIRLTISAALFSFFLPFARCVGPPIIGRYPEEVQVSGLELIFGVTLVDNTNRLHNTYWYPSLILVISPLLCAMASTYRNIVIKGYILNPKQCCTAALIFLAIAYVRIGAGQLYGFYLCALSTLITVVLAVIFLEKDAQQLPDGSNAIRTKDSNE